MSFKGCILFRITDSLATHGLGGLVSTGERSGIELVQGQLAETGFGVLDVRDMFDATQPVSTYDKKIDDAISVLERHGRVVVCCSAGQSRSNSIAIGVLIRKYGMDFYAAFELVREKVPVVLIAPCHIDALKELFKVPAGPP